jgi:Lrp/AsnC family leucine-responsive transcriptional regulator
MDALDLRILTSLDRDARRSFADLARELNVSQPTIADRVRRLEDRGVLRGTLLNLDLARLGYGINAFVRIRSSATLKRGLIEAARKMPQVIEMFAVTGEDCSVARIVARSTEDLANVLDRLSAYGQTSTSIVLGTLVPSRSPLNVQAAGEAPVATAVVSELAPERHEATRRARVAVKK